MDRNNNSERKSYRSSEKDSSRPQSELMIDLAVYIVPPDLWREQLHSAAAQIIPETVAAGFIRVHPDTVVHLVRDEIENQLVDDVPELIPKQYVFLKNVGRCLVKVRSKQEFQLKVKNFVPPQSYSPEVFLLESSLSEVSSSVPSSLGQSLPASLIHADSPSDLVDPYRVENYRSPDKREFNPRRPVPPINNGRPPPPVASPDNGTYRVARQDQDQPKTRWQPIDEQVNNYQRKVEEETDDSQDEEYELERQREQEERQRQEQERQRQEKKHRQEKERQRQEEEKQKQEEERRRQEEERLKAEEILRLEEKRRKEEERRQLEEEEKQKKQDEELKRHRQEEERRRQEEERRRLEDDRRRLEEEKERRQRQEEEDKHRKEEEKRQMAQASTKTMDSEKEALEKELENLRAKRRQIEQTREDLIKKAKVLQDKGHVKRSQARDLWKKRYFDEKKKTIPLEEQFQKLKVELENLQKRVLHGLESQREKESKRLAAADKPSEQSNMNIQATRLEHHIEDLQSRLDTVKLKLTTEMKLRNQAETEVKALKAEVLQKKITMTLTRNQIGLATGDPYRSPRSQPAITAR